MSFPRLGCFFPYSCARWMGRIVICFALALPMPVTGGESGARVPRLDATSMAKPAQVAQARMVESYGKLPLSFEANQGQTDAQAKFLSRGRGYALFLTGDEAALALHKASQKCKGESQRGKVNERAATLGFSSGWQATGFTRIASRGGGRPVRTTDSQGWRSAEISNWVSVLAASRAGRQREQPG